MIIRTPSLTDNPYLHGGVVLHFLRRAVGVEANHLVQSAEDAKIHVDMRQAALSTPLPPPSPLPLAVSSDCS